MRRTVLILAALTALGLGGCAISTGYSVATAETTTSLVRGSNEAWASLPPEAGKVLAVSERRAPDSVSQRIVLEGTGSLAGENVLTVTTAGERATAATLLSPPTPTDIDREMAAALPGIAMRRTLAMESNAYGPFGTAFGTAGGTTCLYAWQRVSGPDGKPVDLRLRLCRTSDEATLVGHMRGLRLAYGLSTTVNMNAGALTLDPLAAAATTLAR